MEEEDNHNASMGTDDLDSYRTSLLGLQTEWIVSDEPTIRPESRPVDLQAREWTARRDGLWMILVMICPAIMVNPIPSYVMLVIRASGIRGISD